MNCIRECLWGPCDRLESINIVIINLRQNEKKST